MNKYLKFEYWNTCDLGNIYYQGGQHFIFYLDADVGEPLHEDIEEGQENGDGDFIPTYRRQMKRYRIRTGLIPDFLIDAMQRMKLHDNIELTFKTGEIEKIYNVDIETEWQFEKYAWQGTVTMTFDMDESITVGACCDNLVVGISEEEPEPIPDLYWVAENGSNLTGDGTYERPWATLAYAATQATVAGDIIHVKEGTITETVQSSFAVGVSIIGQGDTSIIRAGAALNPMFIFHSTTQGTNGNQSISYVKFDGELTAQRCLTVKCRSNVKMHHVTVVDFLGESAAVVDFDGRVSGMAEPTTYATGNEIYSCTFTNNGDDFESNPAEDEWFAYSALSIGAQDGILIHDNLIDNVTGGRYGYGIKGIGGWFRGIKIYDNDIRVALHDGAGFHSYAFAIELWGRATGGNEIYGNTCTGGIDFSGYGWDDADAYGFALKVYENSIILAAQPVSQESGILFESGYDGGVYVYRNYVKNFETGLVISLRENSLIPGIDGFYVYYNIFAELGQNATMTGYGMQYNMVKTSASYTPAINNFNVFNNVFYRADGTVQTYGMNFVATDSVTGLGANWSSVKVKNNIFYNVYAPCKWDDQTIDDVEINNNISHGATNNNRFVTCVVTNDTIVAMATDDPLFVSAVDYHLQAGSPAINAGVVIFLMTTVYDFDGVAVSPLVEIGAYQYIP